MGAKLTGFDSRGYVSWNHEDTGVTETRENE
jgi:hypothetical protein